MEGGGYVAWYEKLSVAVSSIDGEKKMKMSGDLNGQGDTVKGVAEIGNDGKITFTPDTEKEKSEDEDTPPEDDPPES